MHDYRKLSQLMERTVHKYNQYEKKARCYGTEVPLTQTEIHTIAVVGDYPNINVTSLAKLRGITKGAASQMIYRLVDKGFIEKRVSPNSDTEVCLSLTESGMIAFKAHAQFHETTNQKFFKTLSEMPKEYEEYLIRLLTEFESNLDEHLK